MQWRRCPPPSQPAGCKCLSARMADGLSSSRAQFGWAVAGAAAMPLSFQIANNAGATPAQNVIYITDL